MFRDWRGYRVESRQLTREKHPALGAEIGVVCHVARVENHAHLGARLVPSRHVPAVCFCQSILQLDGVRVRCPDLDPVCHSLPLRPVAFWECCLKGCLDPQKFIPRAITEELREPIVVRVPE